MDVYSLNPQVLPSAPLPKEAHRNAIKASVATVVLAAILGLVFWQFASRERVTISTTDEQSSMQAEVLSILRSSSVQVTTEDIDSVVSSLSKSKTAVSEEDRQGVLNKLRNN